MPFAVIAENDESQWHDVTGVSYHFPLRYRKLLPAGTRVVYYKGRLKNERFRATRLSPDPHYFGVARIGKVYSDPKSHKGDFFAEIQDFRKFARPVAIRQDGHLLETIPANREVNYWRDGVRVATDGFYNSVLALADLETDDEFARTQNINDIYQGTDAALTSAIEGRPSVRLTTTYERNPKLRAAAIAIHGTTCIACGFNFAEAFGQHGAGYIHVHHLRGLAEGDAEREVSADRDMIVLCANCHAMVHRYRERTLTLEDLRRLIEENHRS